MDPTSYQVELRKPNGGQSDYWGVTWEQFTTLREAAGYAADECPEGWEWRVVRVRLDVVETGASSAAITAGAQRAET